MVGLGSVEEADRRQALIERTRLAELEGFAHKWAEPPGSPDAVLDRR